MFVLAGAGGVGSSGGGSWFFLGGFLVGLVSWLVCWLALLFVVVDVVEVCYGGE